MKLALGFILRNESFLISQILSLLGHRFDLLLALDYGSEDGTQEKLLEHGVIFQEKAWPDSYAQARNDLIAFARDHGATHILMLDGDEAIFPEAVDYLRQCQHEAGGNMPRVNLLPGGKFQKESWPDLQTRFLNLSCRVEFRNTVHEVPFLEGHPIPLQLMPQTALLSEVVIYHYSLLKPAEYIWRKENNYQRLQQGGKTDWTLAAPDGVEAPAGQYNFHGRLPIDL